MIIGVGTDLIQITRIEALLAKYGDVLKRRLLNDCELAQLSTIPLAKQANFVAKRFAAKESVSKALGVGIGQELGFKDITILNNPAGQPKVQISVRLHQWANYHIHLSLSDDYPVAIAFTVISV